MSRTPHVMIVRRGRIVSAADDGGESTQASAPSTAVIVRPDFGGNVISAEEVQQAREEKQHAQLSVQWKAIKDEMRRVDERIKMLNEIVEMRELIKAAGEKPVA